MPKPYHATQGAVAGKREVYEVDEIRRVLKACPDSPAGHRDRFMVMLLWCTGLKTSELLSLRPKDYSRDVITAGKREVVVPGGQRDRLLELHGAWLEHRSAIAYARSPLLCSLAGAQLDPSYVRHALAALAEAAELGRALNAQGLRNTFAAAMHNASVPMEIIRRQLGLSDLEYTAALVALVAPKEQFDAMGTFSLE
jgi:site-specific recombinase XerD